MRQDASKSEARWRDALAAVLPTSAAADDSILDFLIDEILSSGIEVDAALTKRLGKRSGPGAVHPADRATADRADGDGYEAELDKSHEEAESAIHSVLAEHLSTLLSMSETQIVFLVRDLLDTYLSPPPASDSDGTSKGGPPMPAECELCARAVSLTIHHLFPRSEHSYYLRHPPGSLPASMLDAQGKLSASDMQIKYRAWLCRPCHSAVHRLIPDNRELGSEYWSVERLMGHEGVRRWVGYASGMRQGAGNYQKMGLRHKR